MLHSTSVVATDGLPTYSIKVAFWNSLIRQTSSKPFLRLIFTAVLSWLRKMRGLYSPASMATGQFADLIGTGGLRHSIYRLGRTPRNWTLCIQEIGRASCRER